MLRLALAPFGRRCASFHQSLTDPERLQHGLIVILPGIEGCSSVNDSIARGLVAGQLPHAVQIVDWRKHCLWNPAHLMLLKHNQQQAARVADDICRYQQDYPDRPVHLIGHSAGAGMVLFILQALPATQVIGSAVLIAAAVSRQFDVESLVQRTRRGIWNFYSYLDLPTVGLGTLVFGTMDRRHSVSAGALGFQLQSPHNVEESQHRIGSPQLHQISYQPIMVNSWNFGGHFGSTNAAFVRNHIVPILTSR